MKLIGKLQDGTIFVKKGHDEQEPFEFKTAEGIIIILSFFFLFGSASTANENRNG